MTSGALFGRVVRYADLAPCRTAFIDARTPGSDRKENFTIIGPGVSESPGQHVHIPEPHGFNIGGARQPPHCTNSQHFHVTAEAFFAHAGAWAVRTGEHADEGFAVLRPGDLVSVPVHVFRGFENIGDDVGFLYFMLGGDDPGRVTWAPDVLERARAHGLVLLESGRLIDTRAGEIVPADARQTRPMSRTELAAAVAHADSAALADVIVSLSQARPFNPAYAAEGVGEAAMIGPANAAEGAPAGKLGWPHGYVTRRLSLAAGAASLAHRRAEPEVLFVHEGALRIEADGDGVLLGPGDTLSVPVGAARRFSAPDGPVVALVTRRGDAPEPARLV